MYLPVILHKSLYSVQVFSSRSGGLEGETSHMASGVVSDLHLSILLNPQPAHYYVVYTAIDISPTVALVPSGKTPR